MAVGGTGEDDRYSTGSLIKATQAHNAGIKPGPVDCPLVMYVLVAYVFIRFFSEGTALILDSNSTMNYIPGNVWH